MKNEQLANLDAKNVISAIGADGEGKMTAVRNVSDLLVGNLDPAEFDKITELVRNAQANETLSPRRQAFNDSYLKTLEALTQLS